MGPTQSIRTARRATTSPAAGLLITAEDEKKKKRTFVITVLSLIGFSSFRLASTAIIVNSARSAYVKSAAERRGCSCARRRPVGGPFFRSAAVVKYRRARTCPVGWVSREDPRPTMALNPTTTNDHTVNKVAVCSAIFAGFAYVGYSVAKNAFGRRLGGGRKNDDGTFTTRRCRIINSN